MNEVKLLNIGGIDQNVKDQYARDIIAPSENGLDSTSNLPVASRHYDAGEFLIGQDRLYYEALVEINVGDTLVVNGNIKATTVSDEIVSLRGKSADSAIECIAPIESTGLSTAEYAVGEYLYWEYGLNAGLYKAKTVINIGDAFIVDTNIEAAEPITKSLAGIDGLREEFTQVNNDLGAKNLLPSATDIKVFRGITFTPNADGSISVSGTATGHAYIDLPVKLTDGVTYTASGISGGSQDTYQVYLGTSDGQSTSIPPFYDGEVTFTKNSGQTSPDDFNVSNYRIRVTSGATVDFTIYPMIRPAYITDNTYEPYARSNQELTGEVEPMLNVLGAKNLLPNNAATQTVNGITYTVLNDRSVRVNGTATANSYIYLFGNSAITKTFSFPVICSGCPRDNQNGAMRISFAPGFIDSGKGVIIPPGTSISPFIFVTNGTTVNNAVFKPMIRPASIKDNTYVPYAMTNRELTEAKIDSGACMSSFTITGGSIYSAERVGKHVIVTGSCSKITAANTLQQIGSISNASLRPTYDSYCFAAPATASDNGTGYVLILSNGAIYAYWSKATTYGLYFTLTYNTK